MALGLFGESEEHVRPRRPLSRESRVRDNKIYNYLYIGIFNIIILCSMLSSRIILFCVRWRLRFSSDAVTHFFFIVYLLIFIIILKRRRIYDIQAGNKLRLTSPLANIKTGFVLVLLPIYLTILVYYIDSAAVSPKFHQKG